MIVSTSTPAAAPAAAVRAQVQQAATLTAQALDSWHGAMQPGLSLEEFSTLVSSGFRKVLDTQKLLGSALDDQEPGSTHDAIAGAAALVERASSLAFCGLDGGGPVAVDLALPALEGALGSLQQALGSMPD